MKTLHLNLHRKWFDMIKSGEKKEEYRKMKPYWDRNFKKLFPFEYLGETYIPIVETITFSNGYAKDRDQFVIEYKGIEKRTGKPEWGAVEGEKYYVLKLGEIIP